MQITIVEADEHKYIFETEDLPMAPKVITYDGKIYAMCMRDLEVQDLVTEPVYDECTPGSDLLEIS